MRPAEFPTSKLLFLFTAVIGLSCGPSVEKHIADLAHNGERRAGARQALLLAKDRSVGPLLQALEKAQDSAFRLELVEVMVGLMTRVDNERLGQTLLHRLQSDPAAPVRARIARYMGLYEQKGAIEALFTALDDGDGEVRHQAILALGSLEGALPEEQKTHLQKRARDLLQDPHPDVQLEAMIRVENFVSAWIQQAQEAELKAQMAQAESLYAKATAYAPVSRRALYRTGRFYFDKGERQRGLDLLRRHNMALDVPRLARPPALDGRLDDDAWQGAAHTDSFYLYLHQHHASPLAPLRSELFLGYTNRALYIGFRGHDHPDSLVIIKQEFDSRANPKDWYDDHIEIFVDANFDHQTYAHITVDPKGVVNDKMMRGQSGNQFKSWNADGTAAAHIGDHSWSVEYELRFGQKELPAPAPGAVWSFNINRCYRGSGYCQWTRTIGNTHAPNDFGLLIFQ